MQSPSNKYVYALGDVIGKYTFTPVASLEARACLNFVFGDKKDDFFSPKDEF